MDRTYRIPEENVAKFETKVAHLVKMANKLCSTPIVIESVGEDFEKIANTDNFRRFVLIRVAGEEPKLSNWTFLGSLDIIPEVGTIVRCVPGVTLPSEYHEITVSRCDHCHKSIRRVNHHIVQNSETGEIKVVGSSCLSDFIGHNVEGRLAYCEWLLRLDEECENAEMYGCDANKHYTDLEAYLSWVAMAIRLNGWVSRKTAMEHDHMCATADVACTMMGSKEKDKRYPSVEDCSSAEKAVEWVRNDLVAKVASDYDRNLVTLGKASYIPNRSFGLAASILSAYYRAIGAELIKKYEKVTSQYAGTVGEKITTTVEIVRAYEMESEYGVRCMYRMRDENGNVLVWWASKVVYFGGGYLEPGNKIDIKGTIKNHEDYKGIKQTVLTRCKVLKLHVVEKEAA